MLCVDTEQFQEVDPAYLYCSRVPGFQGLGFRVQGLHKAVARSGAGAPGRVLAVHVNPPQPP